MAAATAYRQVRGYRRHIGSRADHRSVINLGFHGFSYPAYHTSLRIKDGRGIEVKLSTNPSYRHGYETQIEEYGKAENTNKMIYVLIDIGNLGKVKTIENMYSEKLKSGEKTSEILIINAVGKKSVSIS